MPDRLIALSDAGVSIWLDDLSRERIETGNLVDLVNSSSVVGVTTNPSIFAAALQDGERYDAEVRDLAQSGADVETTVFQLTTGDVRAACDVLKPVFDATGGVDGRVSIEVSPTLANDTEGTIASAKDLWKAVDRDNLLIKIPATDAGAPAITAVLAEGISVNVTLIFGLDRYREVMESYVAGLEQARGNGHDLSKIHSVASFFVSRVDTEIDKRLADLGADPELFGRAGIANARLAFEAFEEFFSGERWQALAVDGANKQRPLWASTGVKNPDYRDTMYVTDLVVPETVNTMPEKTLEAFADHGEVLGDQVSTMYDDAHATMESLAVAGIDYDDVISVLETEGVDKFIASWNELLDTVRGQLDSAGRTGMTETVVNGAPVDATATDAWSRLSELSRDFAPDLRASFADDPERAKRLTFTAADLYVDLSKNLVNADILDSLLALAAEVRLTERRDAMFAGEHINVTEDRAVLHTALRSPSSASLSVDGQNAVAEVHAVLARVYAFAEQVRSGAWTGVTGEPIRTVVNIGIGGSDLGPVMAYEALSPYVQEGLECRFISNVDPTDTAQKLRGLDPATTLFIVSSKTFGTLETLTNARLCKAWLLDGLAELDSGIDPVAAVAKHFVAVSTALDRVADFGIDPDNAFGFWDWVGGRYSLDSAIGTSLVIALGPDRFAELLAGFHEMDEHFRTTPLEANVPVLMGLINIWHHNFLGAATHAVLPYAQLLHRFPAYLQQLTMESNGKSVRWDGTPVTTETGEVFWGEPGTNGQHAFYQLIHQGTQLIPADFIAFANPAYPLTDVPEDGQTVDVHELLLANFFAQTKALAFGKTVEEVQAEGTDEAIVTARVFEGNRPTTSIMAPELSPGVLGQLIALYEHLTFVEGVVWGIDSFDQWGVELGKQLAQQLEPAVAGDLAVLDEQDASTKALITYYRDRRR